MALSNIFREPRREITETAVGLGIFGALAFVDYVFARRLQLAIGDNFPLGIAMVVTAVVILVAVLVFVFVHSLGEAICNTLARRGLELRPKRRG